MKKLFTLVAVAALAGLPSMARAGESHHGGGHDRGHDRGHGPRIELSLGFGARDTHHVPAYAPPPPVVYAPPPPPVVYAPPPVYYSAPQVDHHSYGGHARYPSYHFGAGHHDYRPRAEVHHGGGHHGGGHHGGGHR